MSNQQTCPQPRSLSPDAVMLTIDGVAAMLACSPRTVHRLVDTGRIPRPVRLGGMIRWPREHFERWVSQGCLSPDDANSRPKQIAESL